MSASVAALLIVGALAAPADLRRARQQVPGPHVVGHGHVGMTQKLNSALKAMNVGSTKACDEFSVEGLIALQRKLHHFRDPTLEAIYRETGDRGRRMSALGVYTENLRELEGLWEEELAMLKVYPQLVETARDRKCHEVVMWLVHHVPQAAQAKFPKEVVVPLLPGHEHQVVAGVPRDVAIKLSPPGGLGCDIAHTQQSQAKQTEYVEWPEELTYVATGHGAFPFWDNGGPGCSSCDPSVSNSAQLKVMYSSKLKSEILMHESCGDMSWTGSSSAPKNSPCNHIFTPDFGAFLYTPKTSLNPLADGAFCCQSVQAGSKTFTGAVPRDWMKTSSYAGTYSDFKGDHYSGPIKMFTAQEGLQFWYYTQPDGTPVQQGEGCEQPKGKKPTACAKMMPIVLYHDFDPATWKNASFTSSDFAVPEVCKNTTISCTIPGGDNADAVIIV